MTNLDGRDTRMSRVYPRQEAPRNWTPMWMVAAIIAAVLVAYFGFADQTGVLMPDRSTLQTSAPTIAPAQAPAPSKL